MSDNSYLLTDDQGQPLGMIGMDAIQARATRLGYAMAVASNDPGELEAITTEALEDVGHRAFGYVTAAALRFVVEDILDSLIQVGEAHGYQLRQGLRTASANAEQALAD